MITQDEENRVLCELLLDAAADEYADELSDLTPLEKSARFQRKMSAMLANPDLWAKRVRKPLWRRVLQTAAVLFLTFSISLGTLMAVSPSARAAIVTWAREWYETNIVYRFSGKPTSAAMPEYHISSLPESYDSKGDELKLLDDTEIIYKNKDGKAIRFEYALAESGSAVTISTENMTVVSVSVNDDSGEVYLSTDPKQSNAIVWYDEQTNIQFVIDGFFNKQELLHMAESTILCEATK